MTQQHDQRRTIHLLEHVPEHAPRAQDAHYHLFDAAKKRIQAAGLWRCSVSPGPHSTDLELHHSKIEFSLQGGVDVNRFNQAYGLHLTDESFQDFIESEGNLEVLCMLHHRGRFGVHVLPEPEWSALRVWRDGVQPPAEFVPAAELSNIH